MSLPYICSACKARLLLSRLPKRARVLSPASASAPAPEPSSTSRLHTTPTRHGRDTNANGLGAFDRSQHQQRHSSRLISDANGNGSIRGRYSGRELSPEELLTQLDQSWQSRSVAAKPHTSRNATPSPGNHPPSRSPPRSSYTSKKEVPLSTALSASSRAFVKHVNDDDFPRAWATLQLLARECEQETSAQSAAVMRTSRFVPLMHIFISQSIRQWLLSFSADAFSTSLPSPRELFQTLLDMRASRPSFFRAALWQAAVGICDERAKGLSAVKLDDAARNIAEMWRLCLAFHHDRESTQPISLTATARAGTDWSFLPSDLRTATSVQRTFAEVLGDFVPAVQKDMETKELGKTDYASAAILTLDILRSLKMEPSDQDNLSTGQSLGCPPLADFFESILSITARPQIPILLQEKLASTDDKLVARFYAGLVHRLDLDETAQRSVKDVPEDDLQPVKVVATSEGPDAIYPSQDSTGVSDGSTVHVETRFAQAVSPDVERFSKDNIKRLSRAVGAQDMYLAEKIRREVYAFAGANNNESTALPLELYEHLLLTFLTLRNPKAAIDIWNHIINTGYTPTVKTYTVMMRGAQASRDASGMEAFWQKMRSAGYQPDEFAWSIRIFGLLKLKLIKRGLQALNEMGQEWFAAAKAQAIREKDPSHPKQMPEVTHPASHLLVKYPGPIGDIPRPNLVVMNSAVSALAATGEQEIPKVLAWGRSFAIDPDTVTYNALLNIAMRHGQANEALGILRRMNERGVAADSTMWTVLLTALFQGGFLDGLDHIQQQDKILTLIKSLEAPESGNPGIDDKGYALIIDRLLKFHQNASGAHAVLSHMTAGGRTPSTHIYTILITSYFQKEPKPDLMAIEALWKQLEAQNSGHGARLDNVFYDRMIEGYAIHHRHTGMQPALGFLKRARQAGQKPGWRALEAVARALAERQDWSRLRALVDDVRRSLREARGATQHMGQRNFWSFIIETGLLSEEGITVPEQLLPAVARRSPLLQAAEA